MQRREPKAIQKSSKYASNKISNYIATKEPGIEIVLSLSMG